MIDLCAEKGEQSDIPNEKYSKDFPGEKLEVFFSRLIRAYSLGDMLQDVMFCNMVFDEMVDLSESTGKVPSHRKIHEMWDTICQTSKFAQLWVDYLVTDMHAEAFVKHLDVYPVGFVKQIAKVCVEQQSTEVDKRKPRNRTTCYYHDHKDEADKCK